MTIITKQFYAESIIRASGENQHFAYAKTQTLISFALAKPISAFATRTVQLLFFLKFPASSHLLCLSSLVCVGPVQTPHYWFSHAAALIRPSRQATRFAVTNWDSAHAKTCFVDEPSLQCVKVRSRSFPRLIKVVSKAGKVGLQPSCYIHTIR